MELSHLPSHGKSLICSVARQNINCLAIRSSEDQRNRAQSTKSVDRMNNAHRLMNSSLLYDLGTVWAYLNIVCQPIQELIMTTQQYEVGGIFSRRIKLFVQQGILSLRDYYSSYQKRKILY